MPRNAKRVKAAYDSYTVTQGHTMKVLRSEILMLPSLIFLKVQWNKLGIQAHLANARSSSCSAVYNHLFRAAML